MDETLKFKIENSYKVIQYSSLAIGSILAIATYFRDNSISGFFYFLLIPLFLFTGSISSAVSDIMHLTDEEKDKEDWFFRLMHKLHNNMVFKSWYLFLWGILSVEFIVLFITLKSFHIIN